MRTRTTKSERKIKKQPSAKLSHAAEQFEESVRRMDLMGGLELAIKAEEDIILESMLM